ncbi:MAG: outer membrane protein assembly factor BamA [Pseudomonadota bacterium]|nr:MAG: outer membrane protein assembly factor BamA [Pseudomonadota bacterium]
MRKTLGLALLLCVWCGPTHAFEPFVVQDIRLEGLQRIAIGTVFNYLPIAVGDTVDQALAGRAVRALFKTGFFKDVRLEREGNVLVVFVAERPAISSISFSGNKDITSDQLKEALEQIGLREGRVFDRSMLEKVQQELERQYFSQGKYGIDIQTEVTPLERNRADIQIRIYEGEAARIFEINVVGNTAYDDFTLLDKWQLAGESFFTGKKKYSKQLLAADLESLKSYYMDRGYINFNIDSTQVSLTPDKQHVYITVNITEGLSYTVSDVKLAGDLILPEEELMELVTIEAGEVFSRRKTTESTKQVSDRLAENGYAFANINMIPDIDKEKRTVALTLFVDPGRRINVRRINITGNTKSKDEVIRRELRQMEGGWLSTKRVADSRLRLDRLGYFEQVNIETPTVPDTNDQVDVNLNVKERPTGQLSAGLGFSDTQGLIVNLGISQNNFVGTGNRVSANVDFSKVTKSVNIAYTDPYITRDAISGGFRVFFRDIDAGEANITNYTTNSFGASVNAGIPFSEITRVSASFGYENTELLTSDTTAEEIVSFVEVNGNKYDLYPIETAWNRDSRNRAIFPDKGSLTRASAELATPLGSLEYYRLTFRHAHYFALSRVITGYTNIDLGYGDDYGESQKLCAEAPPLSNGEQPNCYPPFKNFFAGGARSVRGYEAATLGGPSTRDASDNPIGGQTRVVLNAELIFPNPFDQNSDSVRFSLFVDGGWVYAKQDSIDLGELRYSAGIGAIWMSPLGALRFSLAQALNDTEGDKTETFQFTLGTAF